MGYGPNIITNPTNRLETGIGSWTENPIQGSGSLSWTDGARIKQESAPPVLYEALLEKDYFSPIDIRWIYTATIEVYHPSAYQGLIGLTLGFHCTGGYVPSVELSGPPLDTWHQALTNFVFDVTFDNPSRQIYLRLNSLEPAAELNVKNLSIRPWIFGKKQYLPVVGVG